MQDIECFYQLDHLNQKNVKKTYPLNLERLIVFYFVDYDHVQIKFY